MTRVHLAIGLVALFALSYGAIERASVSVVDREAMSSAQKMAWAARAEGQAAWAQTLDQRRGLVQATADALGEKPDAAELRRAAEVLGVRLGGASAILDRDGRPLVRAGDPDIDLSKIEVERVGRSADALALIHPGPKPSLVVSAQPSAGLTLVHVQPLDARLLQAWLGAEGGGQARLALVGSGGQLLAISGGGLAGALDTHGLLVNGEDVFASSTGELHDDRGGAIRVAGLGRKDLEPARRMTGVIRVSILALGSASIVLILIVLGVIQSFDVKERLYAEAAARADSVQSWRKVGSSSEPPAPRVASVPSAEVREPHFEGPDTVSDSSPETEPDLAPEPYQAAEPGSATEVDVPPLAADEDDAADDAEPYQAPWSDSTEIDAHDQHAHDPHAYDPHAHSPEYASEITPYADPLNPSGVPAQQGGVTTGFGFSPPPSRPPPAMPPVSAVVAPYASSVPSRSGSMPPYSGSMPPITSVAPGSGFASGFGSGVHRPSQPVASASPITQQPNLRSSMPPAHVLPFDVEHYRTVYNEFVGNKRRMGESVEKITLEGFSAKLRRSEEQLIQKHGCRAVRFQVIVRAGQVSLRPQLVR